MPIEVKGMRYMRTATYDRKSVICKNASTLGYGVQTAKPGSWISFYTDGRYSSQRSQSVGRVLGRVASVNSPDGEDKTVVGHLLVMKLDVSTFSSYPAWINPLDVTNCRDRPPVELMRWITGDEWVSKDADILRMLRMSDYGTTSEEYIASRNDDDKPYNESAEDLVPNIDAMEYDDLTTFWIRHANGANYRELFPAGGKGTKTATAGLSGYAMNKSSAHQMRLQGRIADALKYEEDAERIYQGLPNWAQW